MRQASTPLAPDVGVIALVQDSWNGVWQPRHHVLSRLARYFHVLWVEPGIHWRDYAAGVMRGGREDPRAGTRPGFHLLAGQELAPIVHRPRRLYKAIVHGRWRHARHRLEQLGCRKIVLYLWRPQFAAALEAVRHDLACYHIDDEYSWSERELPMDPVEQALIQKSQQVFIHSPELLKKKGAINPATMFVPNGVDYAAYSTPVELPADLAGIPRPIVGYTGFIKPQLDFDLLRHLATMHPAWSFVLTGVVRAEVAAEVEALRLLPNVHVLGAKTVHELAAYPQHFDACIMPYKATGYTKFIYPMKLHEYLASGQPVVGTRLPALLEFEHCVGLASTAQEWDSLLEAALDPAAGTETRRALRQEVALAHDWDVLTAGIADRMAARVGARIPEGRSTATSLCPPVSSY
jgi:glycosyltransferase involved in cell wall biosynthesis